ncbi:hypothetical protein D4764_07G0010160, partial [Takifugu flavidus]
SGKKSICNESVSAKKNGRLSLSAIPPPIPMSPIVEKMEGLKAIHNRSNSLRLGRLAFYRHLEKVETMRSFWELKHVEMERGQQQVRLHLCPSTSPQLLPESSVHLPHSLVIVLVCVGLGGSARQKYIGEVLRPELKDTTGVSLTYQQKQQTSDSAHSDDTPNPTPPVTFSSRRQRVLSF